MVEVTKILNTKNTKNQKLIERKKPSRKLFISSFDSNVNTYYGQEPQY